MSAPAPSPSQPDLASGLASASLPFVEAEFEKYLDDPNAVPEEWRSYFDQLKAANGHPFPDHITPRFRSRSIFHGTVPQTNGAARSLDRPEPVQHRVDQMVRNFRVRGHVVAKIDPLDQPRPDPPELHLEHYQFTQRDLGKPVTTTNLGGPPVRTIGEVFDRLRNTYCRSIGVQFMHIDSYFQRTWLQERMEARENRADLDRDTQLRILRRLTESVEFETFIRRKYPTAKSFSLEGGETLIPLLDLMIDRAGEDGVDQIVLGMAHRGRLNVLANTMRKPPRHIFREFDDCDPEEYMGSGDVKYHLGYSNDWTTSTGKEVHLSLCFNPSHLEFVNTVAMGKVRAKQDRLHDKHRSRAMPVLIHGDAAFIGEGVVQETLNLSELKGYRVGGTIHVVLNNQIGFTTGRKDGRSCEYATDVAKMLDIPIFHVNGEDPEAVAQVVNLAMDFRKKFRRDVVIDMLCFRQHGHNETDEPGFTQPVMYRRIHEKEPVRQAYLHKMLDLDGISEAEAKEIDEEVREFLEEEFKLAKSDDYERMSRELHGVWKPYFGGPAANADEPETGIDRDDSRRLLDKLVTFPKTFQPHPRLKIVLSNREKMAKGKLPLDWATAELLAFASVADAGHRVRLSGQDCRRGTFSQRHSVLYDSEDGRPLKLLTHLSENQADVEILNSPLSEAGVMGFDYGYSLDFPDALICWEAQFGDFANAAQVIIDQFVSSAEDKWNRLSGLVLMLPHGFEGQGPEHSSARLERFLNLAAEDNMQIVQASTAAQHFHCLRRQVLRKWRKPLVLMTPKSMLRNKAAASALEDFDSGTFQRVFGDRAVSAKKVKRILLCSGKLYWELNAYREEHSRDDVAILRIEELYPFPEKQLDDALVEYKPDTPAFWIQEEPQNMGAWRYLFHRCGEFLFDRFPLEVISRSESASPATGSSAAHKIEQQRLIESAFGQHELMAQAH